MEDASYPGRNTRTCYNEDLTRDSITRKHAQSLSGRNLCEMTNGLSSQRKSKGKTLLARGILWIVDVLAKPCGLIFDLCHILADKVCGHLLHAQGLSDVRQQGLWSPIGSSHTTESSGWIAGGLFSKVFSKYFWALSQTSTDAFIPRSVANIA